MQLIPKNIQNQIPKLYETEDQSNPTVYVKLFIDAWTWYITELSIDNDICFGYVVSPFQETGELGYFSLNELKTIRGKLGLPIQRDLYFKPTQLSIIKKEHYAS